MIVPYIRFRENVNKTIIVMPLQSYRRETLKMSDSKVPQPAGDDRSKPWQRTDPEKWDECYYAGVPKVIKMKGNGLHSKDTITYLKQPIFCFSNIKPK